MKASLYPLKFTPILQERLWGGQKLMTVLNKNSEASNIGESWEISDVEGFVSVVSEGPLKGVSLKEVLEQYGPDLIGTKNHMNFGNTFPLLIKFIDAKTDLSIQLHPNDELAAKRHNSFGKTEMWFVMQADENANLIVGFNQPMTPELYLSHLENKTLAKILKFNPVDEGDTYFIEVGRVHAIGAGVLLAEIQQTSDITYRVYDWDRVDDKGNPRELHTDLALDAIDFNMKDDYKVTYDAYVNRSNEMVNCPYFITNYLQLSKAVSKKNDKDSFLIYICVDGQVRIKGNDFEITVSRGETVLVPASLKEFELISENAQLLEVYV